MLSKRPVLQALHTSRTSALNQALCFPSPCIMCDGVHGMQMADIRYTSKDAFAGSAFHILHRGANYVVYIVTAKETGLKLLVKAYDMGK